MNDLADIIERFWALTEERVPAAKAAITAMREGHPKEVFALKDVVHGIKGESQLLRLRACARLTEAGDQLVSRLIDAPHDAGALDALDAMVDGIAKLVESRGDAKAGNVDVDALTRALDEARGALGA